MLAVVGSVVFASTRPPAVRDPLAGIRADADAALTALGEGDLAALDTQLSANRGQADFAYFFTSKTTPRMLGDALSSVADASEADHLRSDVDPHAYEMTLVDLAGTLGLATFGTGARDLPAEWTADFITATTTPEELYPDASDGVNDSDQGRADQDQANKQNLLLILSRGYWSTDFLESVTSAYWRYDLDRGDDAWAGTRDEDAKYAPASSGHYLTDGILALTAALTANPEASAWAFTDFQPGTTGIEGSEEVIGRFTHFLLFEHSYPTSSDGESLGMTAALTALSSAIDATNGIGPTEVSSVGDAGDVGPMHDSVVLQALAKKATESSGCSWNPLDYWHCAVDIAETVWHWIQRWGHTVLEILAFATFLPPPFTAIGVAAAVTNATWYAIDGDYVSAGLSLASAVPGLAFTKIARGVRAGMAAEKAAAEAEEVANAAKAFRAPSVTGVLTRAKVGASTVERSPKLFSGRFAEKEAETVLSKEFPGSIQGKSFACPVSASTCKVRRIVDIYVPDSRTAVEVKVGVRNQAQGIEEINKDLELLADPSTGISTLRWDFFPDGSGRVGPSDGLRAALQAAGIPYVLHIP